MWDNDEDDLEDMNQEEEKFEDNRFVAVITIDRPILFLTFYTLLPSKT